MIGLALSLVLAAAPATALERAAESAAAAFDQGSGSAQKLVVAVSLAQADTPELSRVAQTLVVEELTRRGVKAVLPLACPVEQAEDAARQAGADYLLRLTVRIVGGELTLAGDKVPTWVNFWTGQAAIRPPGAGPVVVQLPVDAQVLALANLASLPARGEVATRFTMRTLAKLPEKVVALAVGDLGGDAAPEIAALTTSQVIVLSAAGQVLARRDLNGLPRSARPPREPAGAVAIEPAVEKGARPRLLAFSLSRSKGEALVLDGDRLEPVASLEQPALASAPAGTLSGLGLPGKNLFAPEVRLGSRPAVLPFGPVAVAATARSGGPLFAVVSADGAVATLDAELKATPVAGQHGAALALGDVDGDGGAELVTSGLARGEDRVRLVRPANPVTLWETHPVPESLVAAAAGDLDGCGRDEAVLAGWAADGSTTLFVLGAQR